MIITDYRWDEYAQSVREHRQLLGQLPARVAEDIAYRNAERVFGMRVDEPGAPSR